MRPTSIVYESAPSSRVEPLGGGPGFGLTWMLAGERLPAQSDQDWSVVTGSFRTADVRVGIFPLLRELAYSPRRRRCSGGCVAWYASPAASLNSICSAAHRRHGSQPERSVSSCGRFLYSKWFRHTLDIVPSDWLHTTIALPSRLKARRGRLASPRSSCSMGPAVSQPPSRV